MSRQKNAMHSVVTRYCVDFPIQVARLVEETEKALSGSARADLIPYLVGELHRMDGTAQCMGFKFLGQAFEALNRDLDKYCQNGEADQPVCLNHMLTNLKSIASYERDIIPGNSKLLKQSRALDDLINAENECTDSVTSKNAETRVLSRERILFADDDAHVRALMERTFLELGIQFVRVVSSGSEVLEALKTFEPTMIITDWIMQPVNGLELLKKIRGGETNLAVDTPVIFFTSLKHRDYVQEATRHGANKLLPKPVVPKVISKTVLSIVEKKYHQRRTIAATG